MSGKYVLCTCRKCKRQYYFWKDKGLFASRKFCPDCNVTLKCKEVLGLPIEDMAIARSRPPEKEWGDKQVIDIVSHSAELTAKQQGAINKFLSTGKVPGQKSSYYDAVRKLRKAGKAIFRG